MLEHAYSTPDKQAPRHADGFSLWNVLGGALQAAVPFLIALDYSSRLRDGILLGVVVQLAALTFFFLGRRHS